MHSYKRLFFRFDIALCIGFVFMMTTGVLSYADEITLKGGDVIHGKVIEQNDDGVLLDHEDLGQIKIASDRVASVLIATDEVSQPTEQVEPETGPPAPSRLIEEPEFEKLKAFTVRAKENGWSSSIDLSLTSETGNTDERSFRVGGKLGREYGQVKFASDLSYYNKESDGENTDDKLTIGLLRDRSFEDSDWFFFMMGRYDYDVFESWRHRAAFHTGPGYKLIQKADFWMDLRAGPGVRKEWGSETDDPEAEGLIGSSFEWKPTAKQTFSFKTLFYAAFSDFSDNRTRTTFDWDYLLNDEINLSFVLGILHEYQAVVDPGKDRNDTRIHTGFRFRF
jgi:putative salt-induced outer membrane protein YdiY/preprotein translocase subunit YajC